MRFAGKTIALLTIVLPAALAQAPAQPMVPRPIDIPPWFTQSFLDLRDELQAATQEKKRLLLYFGQDGCPYCRRLMEVNFSQRTIVDKTRAGFRAIALDIWGDLEVTWTDGRRSTEKQLARQLQGAVHADLAVSRRAGPRRDAHQRLLAAAPLRSRARLRDRARRAGPHVGRVHRAPCARSGARRAERRAVSAQGAVRSAPARRQAAGRAVRNALVSRLRRDARRGPAARRTCAR